MTSSGRSVTRAAPIDLDGLRRRMTMKSIKSKRLRLFCFFLTAASAFYLVDCLVVAMHGTNLDVPWFAMGIYAGGPAGFFLTAGFALFGLLHLIFGKDE